LACEIFTQSVDQLRSLVITIQANENGILVKVNPSNSLFSRTTWVSQHQEG